MTTAIPEVSTEVLVIGTGPAGATSAALLATYGVKTLVVNKFASTARTPRSHITNQRTMEVLRDLDVEPEAKSLATPSDLMGENTYCTSLAGVEFGRVRTWGTHPLRRADYDLASPTQMCDLPQNLLEPLLVRAASARGANVRFSSEFVSLEQDEHGVLVTIRDSVLQQDFRVRAQYVIGADGANSQVVEQLGLPLEGRMGVSGSMNIVFEADLSKYVAHRPSVLYWVIQPGSSVGGLGIGVVRMVRPWHRWLAIWGYELADGPPKLDEVKATEIVHSLIGSADIPVRIESTSTWTVNDMYATRLSKGRVFCMGDAVHRHPPTNGLGSNASIQDAYNLCWKLAHVLKGQASPSLLESFTEERAPVAKQVVTRANKSLGDFPPILGALGLFDTKDPVQMQRNFERLQEPSPEAGRQRAALMAAIEGTDYVYNCHGVEMNQRYSSRALVPDGSPEPQWERDRELYHQFSSRPGAPLPHAWLITKTGKTSTLDLCGKGKFTLLTGLTGLPWERAAQAASQATGVDIAFHAIGPGREYVDSYGDFAHLRGTQESGALLVRPDHMVAWRADSWSAGGEAELTRALLQILGRKH